MLDRFDWYILDATADDWESIDQILPYVNELYGSVEARAVVRALSRLVDEGWMRAAHLVEEGYMTDVPNGSLEPETIAEEPTEFWFCMTQRGRTLWDSDGQEYRDAPPP
jgi:hypothetical protein